MFKKLFLFVLSFSFYYNVIGQVKKNVTLNSNEYFEIKSISNDGFQLNLGMKSLDLKTISTANGNYVELSQNLLNNIFTEGMPNIPVLTRLIEIPQEAKVSFQILSYNEQIINLSSLGVNDKIIPAARSLSKNESTVPFVKNESVYQTDAYTTNEIVSFNYSGQLRASNIGRIEIRPIQYNPVQNTLRILNDLRILVKFEDANHIETKLIKQKYDNQNFSFESNQFINQLDYGTKSLISQAPTHLVIVSDRMFQSQLAPFIAWKIKKGFKVTVAYTDVIGTTTTAIKSYLQNIYQGTNPMSFILLVGDVAQVPAWQNQTSGDTHVTDLYYADFTNDHLPDVFYGRFSAQNTAQLQPQIDKTLMYEQFTMPNPAYLSDVLLVAGDDSSHEMTWGNGQLWYGANYYFNASNNTNTTSFLQPSDNNAIHTQIINRVNAGLSFSNYTAHCSSDGWASPSFSVADANGLTNNGKYGLLVGNCCQSSKFEESNSFGETILRKANGGAIGYIGASDFSYWDEDYWWGVGLTSSIVAQPTYSGSTRGAYDGYWHTQANENNNTNSWYTTQSQMVVCGNLAVESSTSSLRQYYWEIYHLMGDPSITPYIGMPQAMSVVASPTALMVGMTSLQVTAAPYSYVALSQNGVLIAAGLANAQGVVTLTFASNALSVGTADLVVTAQNKIPYIGTITISPANEPYVTLNQFTTTPSPNFGQNTLLNVTLENVAALGSGFDANAVVANISTTDAYVTITDNSQNYGQILAGNTALQNNAYAFQIANNVPDQHIATFNMTITDNAGHTWNAVMNITLNAPDFTILNVTVNDATGNNNGILDPGETADLTIQTTNSGHANVSNVIGNISSANTAWTLNSVTTSPTSMVVGNTQSFIFNVTAIASTPQGTPVDLHYWVTGGNVNQYTKSKDYQLIIGFVPTYCDANGASTTDEFIQRVQINTIDNSSTQGPGYSDYTAVTTNVIKGQTYPITITNGEHWSGDQVGCWVDWNYDGDFNDTNETISLTYTGTGSSGSGPGNAVGNIVIPNDAHVGNARLRARVMYSGTLSNCGEASWGEVEDYTLVVQTQMGIEDINQLIGIYPNPTNGSFYVNLNENLMKDEMNLEIYNAVGQKIYQQKLTETQSQINWEASQGMYIVKVSSGNQVGIKKLLVGK